jgi:hypothetical protein
VLACLATSLQEHVIAAINSPSWTYHDIISSVPKALIEQAHQVGAARPYYLSCHGLYLLVFRLPHFHPTACCCVPEAISFVSLSFGM